MAGLGVNIDHVATIRQARMTIEPDPVWAAVEAELAGADCITFHLRKDRRHITDRDAQLLRQSVRCKLNMEMSLDDEIVQIALKLRPNQVTLVPENRQEITTEGGLDVVAHAARLTEVTKMMHDAGVTVSAFIDPHSRQIEASNQARCDAFEIHTGQYANVFLAHRSLPNLRDNPQSSPIHIALEEIRSGLSLGRQLGMDVHAGHGLTYNNVAPVAAMRGFGEFNIGHSIIARAVFTGLREAVAEMKRLIVQAG
jgi:pyridoxine 5-phosphate synthase